MIHVLHRTEGVGNNGFKVADVRRKEYENKLYGDRRQDDLEHFLRVRRGHLLQQRLSAKLREEEAARREAAGGPDVYIELALRRAV